MQKVFLISDTHFSHKNIIDYESRPFKTFEEMDEYMIKQWNDVVSEDDLVFHLGDVTVCRVKRAEEVLMRLNGRKILIEGNHDHFSYTKWRKFGFDVYKHYIYNDYLLTHKPVNQIPLQVAVDKGLLKGNIHGHTHSKNQHLPTELYKCCCVELISYTPVPFHEFLASNGV